MDFWFTVCAKVFHVYFLSYFVVGIVPDTCVEYKAILPKGICAEYLQSRQVAVEKEKAIKINEKLELFYETYISLYTSYETNEAVLKRLMIFYATAECGQSDRLKHLIDSLYLPPGSVVKKCAFDIKNFICKVSYPICTTDRFGKLALAWPCRNQCQKAWSTPSCSFLKGVKSFVEEVSSLCSKWSFKIKKHLQKVDCSNYIQSDPNTRGKDYCLPHNSYTLNSYKPDTSPIEQKRTNLSPYEADTLWGKNLGSCIEYKKVLPEGICLNYLQQKQIALTKEKAVVFDEKLKKFYETYIPLYVSYQANPQILKRLMKFYAKTSCGKQDRIIKLIDSLILPTGTALEKCSSDLKKFICKAAYPICLSDSSGRKSVALPCRDECEKAWETSSCSFLKPLLSTAKEVSESCPAWSVRIKDLLQKADCKMFPSSTLNGEEYCRVNKIDNVLGREIDYEEPQDGRIMENIYSKDATNVMSVVDYPAATNQINNGQPLLNSAVWHDGPDNCVEYKTVLPNGICSKYLLQKQIAQTKEKAVDIDEKLQKLYETYIPLYVSYRTNPKIIKLLMKSYANTACGKHDKITKLLDSLTLPSGTALKSCISDLKKFMCKAAHPICLSDSSGRMSVALPCRDECVKAWETPSCSFLKPLLSTVKEVSESCPAWSVRINKYLQKVNCENFPSNTILGQNYCPLKVSNDFSRNHIDSLKSRDDMAIIPYPSGSQNFMANAVEPEKYGPPIEHSDSLKSNSRNKEMNQCIPYNTNTSPGICREYLKDSYVAQSRNHIEQIDGNMGTTYMMLDTLLTGAVGKEVSKDARVLWSWIWDKISPGCSNISKVNELKRKFSRKINLNETRNCLEQNGWFYCHIFHPKCVFGNVKFKVSPVCRQSCKSTWNHPSCSFLSTLYEAYKEIKQFCIIPFNQHIESLFNCERLPKHDMKHIENCQMSNVDTIQTYSCYQGNGVGYSGSKNTAGGQQCEQWSSDPYLNRKMYPTLVSNYCRNPQGYGARPWCYVNMTTNSWLNCDIPKCKSVIKNGSRLTEAYEQNGGTVVTIYNPPPLIESYSFYRETHSKTKTTTKTFSISVGSIVIGIAVLLVGLGCFTLLCSYTRKKRNGIKEYRGIHQRPDINYVRVGHDDKN